MNARVAGAVAWWIAMAACAKPTTDISGTWAGKVTDPEGTAHDVTITLEAAAGTLTGSVAAPPEASLAISKGSVDGNRVSFEVGTGSPDEPQPFRFTATVSGNEMRGSAKGPRGETMAFALHRGAAGPTAANAAASRMPGDQPPDPRGADPQPLDAQQAILAAFDHYDLVGGMSASHGNKDADDFMLALIRNPALPGKVNDIAVECGNSLYQPILDRYIAGDSVPLADARQAWRNTTQPNCGFSAFYEELFPLIRRINETLPAARKLRVLACDPPIDWNRMKTPDDLRPFEGRDKNIAAVIEREVLAKHRKALLLFGVNHVRHGMNAVGIYEAKYPGRTLAIADHHGFGGPGPLGRYNAQLERRMASWPRPSLVMMKGSWLADLECAYYDLEYARSSGCHGYPGVDAYLYVGPRDLLLREPVSARVVLDSAYMAELARRAAVIGLPNATSPEVTFRRESAPSVFLEDPDPSH